MTTATLAAPDSAAPARLPARVLWTERLKLEATIPDMAPAVCDYQLRNIAHFTRWDPPRAPGFWDLEPTRARLALEPERFATSQFWRYWITKIDEPDRIIGQCQVSQIYRGMFQNAMLGYSLDEAAQGHGYIHEAMRCLVEEMFSPRVRLHRLEAAVRPDNVRSLRVVQRLGFRQEGICKDYLFINGAWRDHHLFAMLNPDWGPDEVPGP